MAGDVQNLKPYLPGPAADITRFLSDVQEHCATNRFLLFFQYTICAHPDPHPYLALLLHRDYFGRPDASLACFSVPQRLFQPIGFIPILLFCATGIILADRMHLYLALLCHRDYFGQPDASLSCSFLPQGLFRSARCISILLFSSTGIISTGQVHLWLAFLFHRDYFSRLDSSPSCSFVPQGLFRPTGCISSLIFSSTGIISAGQIHLYLALLLHRDYFHRSDASLPSSFSPQGLFQPVRYVPYC